MEHLLRILVLALATVRLTAGDPASVYAQWQHGPSADPGYFPIAVWLQSPANAARYRAAGINLYIGLWRGPTQNQLAELQKAGMPVICEQNSLALQNRDNPIIVGWMHGDEPDNAQALASVNGYGPPITPAVILADYTRIHAADPTRPILLNLGQGVAWDRYYGRGVRTNHPEDYPEYVRGGDIVSFDIYPAVHSSPQVAGKLEFVAQGVQRLVDWGQGKPIWNCIECTHIDNPKTKATPHQVRSEVWMSLIRGSRGLIYFVHEFKPTFKEAGLLADQEMLAAVTSINRQIVDLAPVLNSPSRPDLGTAKSAASEAPVAIMMKQHGGRVYGFAVALGNRPARASFKFSRLAPNTAIEVLGESRSLVARDGQFEDDFSAYAVHLYASAKSPVTP